MKIFSFSRFVFAFGLFFWSAQFLTAAIIGTNPPALPLTFERTAALPASQQTAWKNYLERSASQRRTDQIFLRNEMRSNGLKRIIIPPESKKKILPLQQPASWYSGPEARRVAEVVLSFQTPAGGWGKNMDMTGNPRSPGMHFVSDNSSRQLRDSDFDMPAIENWNYVGTFDNDATISQLRFLAKVIAAMDQKQSEKFRAGFLHGLDYIFAAQFPNGGWPQVWPLQGGYHDGVTLNDNAMLNILTLVRNVSLGTNEFAFVPADTRAKAADSFNRGLDCLLALQISSTGRRTIWAQQYDALTLQPTSARNYEMPCMAAGESAGVLMFLMQLPNPNEKIISTVHSAAAWFQKTQIHDFAFKKASDAEGRELIKAPGNGPIWARYYEIGNDQPIFGDRDKSIHDSVAEISKERRNGYAWYGDTAKRALEHYSHWAKLHPVNITNP